jgi:DNA-nicking Smr family endonuclease
MKGARRRLGLLTEEDLRLWAEVARQVEPLRGKSAPAIAGDAEAARKAPDTLPDHKGGAFRPGTFAGPRPKPRLEASAPPLAKLERRFVQRLRRGSAAPGAVIDLHGLRQDEARRRLVGFLMRCQAEGVKSAIVITGKGAPTNSQGSERGVLRRAVPLWLAMPDLRALVIGFEEAGAGLGGSGALILRVRAARRT